MIGICNVNVTTKKQRVPNKFETLLSIWKLMNFSLTFFLNLLLHGVLEEYGFHF